MRCKSLLECVEIPNQQTKIYFRESFSGNNDGNDDTIRAANSSDTTSINLVNQMMHCLFKDKATKLGFYKRQFEEVSHDETNNGGRVYGISCGSSRGLAPYMTILQSNLNQFQQLIDYLELVLSGSDGISITEVINLLIIDNLSMYYWQLKSNIHQSNVNLYELLNQIKSKYRCNILITSFDIRFDKGYNCNWSKPIEISTSGNNLSNLTYLPNSYLLKMDFIIHLDTESGKSSTNTSTSASTTTTCRYFHKLSNKWITLQ